MTGMCLPSSVHLVCFFAEAFSCIVGATLEEVPKVIPVLLWPSRSPLPWMLALFKRDRCVARLHFAPTALRRWAQEPPPQTAEVGPRGAHLDWVLEVLMPPRLVTKLLAIKSSRRSPRVQLFTYGGGLCVHRKSLSRTTSLVMVSRVKAICLPS